MQHPCLDGYTMMNMLSAMDGGPVSYDKRLQAMPMNVSGATVVRLSTRWRRMMTFKKSAFSTKAGQHENYLYVVLATNLLLIRSAKDLAISTAKSHDRVLCIQRTGPRYELHRSNPEECNETTSSATSLYSSTSREQLRTQRS